MVPVGYPDFITRPIFPSYGAAIFDKHELDNVGNATGYLFTLVGKRIYQTMTIYTEIANSVYNCQLEIIIDGVSSGFFSIGYIAEKTNDANSGYGFESIYFDTNGYDCAIRLSAPLQVNKLLNVNVSTLGPDTAKYIGTLSGYDFS